MESEQVQCATGRTTGASEPARETVRNERHRFQWRKLSRSVIHVSTKNPTPLLVFLLEHLKFT